MVEYGAKFPRYLSSPLQMLWWESDEVAVIFVCFMSAMLYGGILWFTLLVVPYLYIKTKKRYPKGFFKHLLYCLGLVKLDGYPSFQEKHFVE